MALGTSPGFALNWTSAYATVGSFGEMAALAPPACGSYGFPTPTTPGSFATWPNRAVMDRSTPGSVTPCLASNTIRAMSPDRVGNRASRRSNTFCDSVPGSEKSVE